MAERGPEAFAGSYWSTRSCSLSGFCIVRSAIRRTGLLRQTGLENSPLDLDQLHDLLAAVDASARALLDALRLRFDVEHPAVDP